ncbi:MAG: beta-lactamase family protein [Oscillospiraceae bacterium]|nr:beta-lactamase family protein [Oscillospiraceae bacterium]
MDIHKIWHNWPDAEAFSGVFSVSGEQGVLFEKCRGFRNQSESLLNNAETAFSIASGTKLFTGLAVCKLIDDKKLSLDDKLCDVLSCDLGQIDRGVTMFHLLTHTSGVGDYIDEEAENSGEQLQALYRKYPVYLWESLEYYLPMITPLPPKFEPGARYGYSNAGFVLLGLVVEAVSGLSYRQFVTDTIITPCRLAHTGFYRMDSLPPNTALGYMRDEETGEWRANIFSLPVLGGSDGGIYTCSGDLSRLWFALFSHKILSEDMTRAFLTPQVRMEEDGDGCYGLGVYILRKEDVPLVYAVGGDCGVDFFTAYFPGQKLVASALGNTELNTFPLLEALREELRKDWGAFL